MSLNNHSIEVPTWFLPVLSDTAESVAGDKQACRGFEVWAAGAVKWTDASDYTQARTFAAPFPVRVTGLIKRIWSNGTAVDVSNIGGLR